MASSSHYPRRRVRAHYRKDGTYVRGHYRARPGTGSTSSYSSSSPSLSTAAAGSGIGVVVFFVLVAVFLELAQRAG